MANVYNCHIVFLKEGKWVEPKFKIISFRLVLNTIAPITKYNQPKKLISCNRSSGEINFHCQNQVIKLASFFIRLICL